MVEKQFRTGQIKCFDDCKSSHIEVQASVEWSLVSFCADLNGIDSGNNFPFLFMSYQRPFHLNPKNHSQLLKFVLSDVHILMLNPKQLS